MKKWQVMVEEYLATRAPRLRGISRKYILDGELRGERIMSFMGNVRGKVVYDVGCGTCGISVAFRKAGAVVYATDKNQTMNEISWQRATDECALPIHLPPAAPLCRTVDIVVLNDVLEHAEDAYSLISDCLYVLRHDGCIWISTPNKYSPKQILREGHSGLFGVSLLPPRMAKWYVEKVRRAMPLYDVNRIHSYGQLMNLFKDFKLSYEMIEEHKPARHFDRVRPLIVRRVLTWLFTKPLRPGFFEFIVRRT